MSVLLEGDTRKERLMKQKISLLKKREKEIREERHRLESELRNLVYLKYARMGEKISLKLNEKEL